MSVLIDRHSRFIIQGITGNVGRFSARDMKEYGTTVVGGVATAKRENAVEGIPVFPDVHTACAETGADASVIYVPAATAVDHVIEAVEAGIKLVAYPGDGLPVRDAIEMRAAAKANGAVLIGPNTPGLISPGKAKAGFMPSFCYMPGPLGVISRSGSLSYEACFRLTEAGLGQTTVIGIGGDPIKGVSPAEALELLHRDPETHAIVYLGEIGGNDEYAVASYASRHGAKPVAALIVGRQAPKGKKMGHAAALIGSHADTHPAKMKALSKAGVHAAGTVTGLVPAVKAALDQKPIPQPSQHEPTRPKA
jgi:succinyl-CoA synthetase alpha subunit